MLFKSKRAIKPKVLLNKFADMAKKSKTFDGDWQGDGWGYSFLDENNNWQCKLSLLPVWEDKKEFLTIPKTRIFLVHARSASFPEEKGIIAYNQPYIVDKYSFVFNGFLKGVALPFHVEGKIGAQKIWNILKNYLSENSVSNSLLKTKTLLVKNSKRIQALNIGVSDKDNIYCLTFYSQNPSYYALRYYNSPSLKIICSEQLKGYETRRVGRGQVKVL